MESFIKQRPTPADVYRATQKQRLEERYTFGAEKMPALQDSPNPAEIAEPVFTHSIDLGTKAIHLEVEDSAPQNIEVHAASEAPAEIYVKATAPEQSAPIVLAERSSKDEDVIPEEVVAEVASSMKRVDFVKQQEDLFGANDDIKPEDVPEGELTYEQYLAQRPVAEEGDFFHENGRIHNALTGSFAKKDDYVAKLENSSTHEHYEKLMVEANRADVIDEAIKENDYTNESNDRLIRTNTEGELLVSKDARLRGLLAVGEELLALYNSELTGEEFEKTIKPALEAKKAIYDDLYELYESKGLDTRALFYIEDKTHARVDDPDFIPVTGSPYSNNEKVAVVDLVETTDGKKAYTIEKSDGSTESVHPDEVTFKREFDKYEAPTEEEPEVEPEQKLSRFERTKKWFGKERKKIQEFGGKAYVGGLWNKAGNWLTSYHINEETMTPAEIQSQKLVNRRNNMLGLAAVVVAGVLAQKLGVIDMIPDVFSSTPGSESLPTAEIGHADGLTADAMPRLPEAAENADSVPMLPGLDAGPDAAPQPEIGHADGGADYAPPTPDASGGLEAMNVNNPAYDIPYAGGGIQLFEGLGLSEDKWNEHAQELLNRFPNTFNLNDGDVRIGQPGLLPLDVREAIESFKNR